MSITQTLQYVDDPNHQVLDRIFIVTDTNNTDNTNNTNNANNYDQLKKTLRIMTYNVHGFMNRQFKKRIDDIFNNIKSIDPDILILEEIYLINKNDMPQSELTKQLKLFGLKYYFLSESGINGVF